ncbi:MAG: HAD hydrolase-like protein [Clostridium sp.]|nr:HAD hydrolase-like protein [Clostridium sp.]
MFAYCLFDLDGTLTDPKEGITKSVQHALRAFGIEEPDLKKLEPFIGPPLKDSFMEFYGFSEEEAVRAIAVYRERFAPIGIFENQIYPGVPEMLARLHKRGVKLAVASSKPIDFVVRILAHFEIDKYFDVVVGSELNGNRVTKEEVVEEALEQLGILTISVTERHRLCAMIGDRKFDIQGAKAYGLTGVGVRFGYAGEGELEEAGAEYIAATVEELEGFL